MRIAVVLESKIYDGGGFQQELAVALLLNRHRRRDREFVFYTTVKGNVKVLKGYGIDAFYLKRFSFQDFVYGVFFRDWIVKKIFFGASLSFFSALEKTFVRAEIDLIYFLKPSYLPLLITKMNYVITVWDLCHRDHPEFPEVRVGGQYEGREQLFNNFLPRAVAVLVDSDLGKENVIRRYGCDQDRIYVARFFPLVKDAARPAGVDIRAKYGLKQPYLFYPAQFWAHKNHVYILDGISLLKKNFGVAVDAVFSGVDKGNLDCVRAYADRMGLSANVHFVGFIPNEEMGLFYHEAIALVMPTYFGPTNIPPLEAFSVGCPVCYSDLPGLREQVGAAAFLMDLNAPETLARHVLTILKDRDMVQEKVKLGKQVLSEFTEEAYWKSLEQIFDRYAQKIKSWKTTDDESGR